jgi:plasmid stabilization system protein ParE
MPSVRLSATARAFVRREAQYLGERSTGAAEAFLGHLREARRNLARFPEMGAKSPLPLRGLRRLVIGDYVLDYDLSLTGVEIVAIRHGRQSDLPISEDPGLDYEEE